MILNSTTKNYRWCWSYSPSNQ